MGRREIGFLHTNPGMNVDNSVERLNHIRIRDLPDITRQRSELSTLSPSNGDMDRLGYGALVRAGAFR